MMYYVRAMPAEYEIRKIITELEKKILFRTFTNTDG